MNNYTTNNTNETIISLIIEGYKHIQSGNYNRIQEYIKYGLENGIFEIVDGELLRRDKSPTVYEQLKYIDKEIWLSTLRLNEFESININGEKNVELIDLIHKSIDMYKNNITLFTEYKNIVMNPDQYFDTVKSFISYE